MQFVDGEEAIARSGLRLVTVAGVPSPWSEAAKGILGVKKIPYVATRLIPGDTKVSGWTGQTSAPVAMYEAEAPRGGWAEILLLCERLRPEPRLIPEDPAQRALLFGLAHEICGEMGLGWCRRLVAVEAGLIGNGPNGGGGDGGFARPIAEYLASKYGYRPGIGKEVHRRVIEILGMLTARLETQREAGQGFYLGERLSALDIYSATFMVLFDPLPDDLCPMPASIRVGFAAMDDEIRSALDPILLEHRDAIYRAHLELPLSF